MPFLQGGPASCAFCERDTNPEDLFALPVPYLDAEPHVCGPCRDDFRSGGRRLRPFEPIFPEDRTFRWPGPDAADARAALAAVRLELEGRPGPEMDLAATLATAIAEAKAPGSLEAIQRQVDAPAIRAEATPLLFGLWAHAVLGDPLAGVPGKRRLPPEREKALSAAMSAYVSFLPDLPRRTALEFRVATAKAALRLERGEIDEADRYLRRVLDVAASRPAERDPRLPALHAAVLLAQGNLDGADRALEIALAWTRSAPEPATWSEARADILHDLSVREVAAGNYTRARERMLEIVRLRPRDRRARFDLAHAYMKGSLDPVAREVLSSALDGDAQALIRRSFEEDPTDLEGRLLFATCLVRLGEPKRALDLLEPHLDGPDGDAAEAAPEALRRAERCHLAGLCLRALGRADEAYGRIAGAYALETAAGRPGRTTRENLVCLVQEDALARIADLTPATLPALMDLLARNLRVIEDDLGEAGIAIVVSFLRWEVGRGFATFVTGPDAFDGARLRADLDLVVQAFILLAKRRLPEAVQAERRARSAGARPFPLSGVMGVLGKLRDWKREGHSWTAPGRDDEPDAP